MIIDCMKQCAQQGNSIQIINKDGIFIAPDAIESFLQRNFHSEFCQSCQMISIVGGQGTGKSTLLNQMFATQLQVRIGQIPKRTTEGLWLTIKQVEQTTFFIFDAEGSGSKQYPNKAQEEQITQLLCQMCIVFAFGVVAINVQWEAIGQDPAQHLILLHYICQQLKDQINPKKQTILFLVRDVESSDFESSKQWADAELLKQIKDVHKEEKVTTPFDDLFDVQILYHATFKENDKFVKDANTTLQYLQSLPIKWELLNQFSQSLVILYNKIQKAYKAKKQCSKNEEMQLFCTSQYLRAINKFKNVTQQQTQHLNKLQIEDVLIIQDLLSTLCKCQEEIIFDFRKNLRSVDEKNKVQFDEELIQHVHSKWKPFIDSIILRFQDLFNKQSDIQAHNIFNELSQSILHNNLNEQIQSSRKQTNNYLIQKHQQMILIVEKYKQHAELNELQSKQELEELYKQFDSTFCARFIKDFISLLVDNTREFVVQMKQDYLKEKEKEIFLSKEDFRQMRRMYVKAIKQIFKLIHSFDLNEQGQFNENEILEKLEKESNDQMNTEPVKLTDGRIVAICLTPILATIGSVVGVFFPPLLAVVSIEVGATVGALSTAVNEIYVAVQNRQRMRREQVQ